MNPRGEVLDVEPWFGRTVIRSCIKMDYATAQLLIDAQVGHTAVRGRHTLRSQEQAESKGCSVTEAVRAVPVRAHHIFISDCEQLPDWMVISAFDIETIARKVLLLDRVAKRRRAQRVVAGVVRVLGF